MDNYQMPGMSGMSSANNMGPRTSGVPDMRPMQPAGPQYQAMGPNGMPMVQQAQAPVKSRKDNSGLIKTIVIILLSLIAVTFIGLFIWMMMQWNEAQTDVDGKISKAVANAKVEQREEDEKEYAEREKNPYKTFAGPLDYGQLTFNYPKTWSVYVAEAANTGGNFNAYFNPGQVDTVSNDTINALRVTILNESFDSVTEKYQRDMDRRDSGLTMESVTIGPNNNITANRYTGTIPNTELNGFIVTFKIRDKTAILQTDSVLFEKDFNELLKTVTFNE